jgi:hypothetical protein
VRPALFVALFAGSSVGCQAFFPLPVDADIDETLIPVVSVAKVLGAPFEEGERLVAKVLVEDVAVGTTTLQAGKKCLIDGQLALPIDGTGKMGGILGIVSESSAITRGFLDLETGYALESRWDFDYGDKRTLIDTDYGPGAFRMAQHREVAGEKPKDMVRRIALATEQTPHDGHSLLGFLRRWDAEEGTQGFAYVFAGRTLLRVEMTFTGRETIRTVLGDTEAVRVDGIGVRLSDKTLQPVSGATAKPFTFWLTDDPRRIPLRLAVETELGDLALELQEYRRDPLASTSDAPKPCDGRVDKAKLDKAKGVKKKRADPRIPRMRRAVEPPFGREKRPGGGRSPVTPPAPGRPKPPPSPAP